MSDSASISPVNSVLATSPQPLVPVQVRAKFLFEGEEKFFLKGITYGPFAPDAEGFFVGTPERARIV